MQNLQSRLQFFDKETQRAVQRALREAAEPIAMDARRTATEEGWGERTVSQIVAASRKGAAVVRQRATKTTGNRGDFGSLQMRKALLPAAEAGEKELADNVDAALIRAGVAFNA